MRQCNGKTRISALMTLSAIACAVLVATLLSATDASAQEGLTCTTSQGTTVPADHLKCYHVGMDPFINTDLLSLNSPQFGVEPSCQVDGKSVQFCVPVCKTVIGPVPIPQGTGFVGTALTDDYLCYGIKCTQSNAPKRLGVEDQFKARTIPLGIADFICAPAEKLPAPACGFGTAKTAAQCGGACPGEEQCTFKAAKKGVAASCACAGSSTPCGIVSSAAAPTCGGWCGETTSGGLQLCRDLGGNCTCTPF